MTAYEGAHTTQALQIPAWSSTESLAFSGASSTAPPRTHPLQTAISDLHATREATKEKCAGFAGFESVTLPLGTSAAAKICQRRALLEPSQTNLALRHDASAGCFELQGEVTEKETRETRIGAERRKDLFRSSFDLPLDRGFQATAASPFHSMHQASTLSSLVDQLFSVEWQVPNFVNFGQFRPQLLELQFFFPRAVGQKSRHPPRSGQTARHHHLAREREERGGPKGLARKDNARLSS
eukprot:scaffold1954_cov268-Pinguiococcus_pyrenoidosus.AAC.290